MRDGAGKTRAAGLALVAAAAVLGGPDLALATSDTTFGGPLTTVTNIVSGTGGQPLGIVKRPFVEGIAVAEFFQFFIGVVEWGVFTDERFGFRSCVFMVICDQAESGKPVERAGIADLLAKSRGEAATT